MSDPVETPPAEADLPLAANGEVKAYDRLGNKVTVPKERIGELYGMGGRVARKAEVTAQQLEADYAKKSTIEKAAGYVTPALPTPIQMALRGAGVASLPPELEAYRAGASSALTGGVEAMATKEAVDIAAGSKAAHAFGQTQIALKDAHAGMYQAGEVAGFIAGAVAGGPKGGLAGKAFPGGAIGAVGGLAEQGAARALAPIAARGAIGRALATGGELAARGAAEGSIYGAAGQITEDMLGDHEIAADKVFSAMGTGALYGGLGGAALGVGGSLAASGGRAVVGAARGGISRALSKGGEVAAEVAADGGAIEAKAPTRFSLDPDAGLRDAGPRAIQKPLKIGKARKEVGFGDFEAGLGEDTNIYPPVIGKRGDVANHLDGRVSLYEGAGHALETEPAPLFMSKNRPVSLKTPEGLPAPEALPSPIGIGEGAAAKGATEVVGAAPAAEASAARKMLAGDVSGGARDAANTMAFDALGTTRKIADKINKEVEGGSRAVGDYVNRRILPQVSGEGGLARGVYNAAKGGRADDLLPLIQADRATIGAGIGDIVQATPVRVNQAELLSSAEKIAKSMASDPVLIQGAEPFRKQVAQTFEAFANGGKIVDGTMDLSDMYYARASMENVAYEMKRSNSAAGDAMKQWLRDVDAHLVDKIDEAARALGDPGAKDKLLGLKREYQLASAAEKAAQDGANRIAGNNSYGIREGIGAAAGLATGHPIAALATAVGGKMLRERGSAAGAYLLTKMADMGTLARALKAVDDQIGTAAQGILAAPRKGPLPIAAPTGTVYERAERAMQRVAELQADPTKIAERAAAAAEPYQNSAPNLANALTQRMTSAYALMVSKMPVAPDPDPFDPHPAPKLTDAQATEYAAYDYYCERPSRFFEEAAHGKITFEGAEVARELMPGAFAQMQQRTLEGLADLMAKKTPPPYLARQRIGVMLSIPAVPEQRPDHMGFLQANVIGSEKAEKAPLHGAQSVPKRPIPTKTQSSTLDRLEGH